MDSKSWRSAFEEELKVINQRRGKNPNDESDLVGLAISGGGIRSATFGLGVLEGLKHFGLLRKIDYLSTVSGGGYIGAWLSANCKRASDRQKNALENGGSPEANWLDQQAEWKKSVDHLRRYSNYLSPRVGFFSADTWSMATTWLRNTMLVQFTLILGIAVLLLVPRPLFVAFEHWPSMGNWRWSTIVLFILAVVGIGSNQLRLNCPEAWLLQAKNWLSGLVCSVICLALAWAIGQSTRFNPFAVGPINYQGAAPIAFLLVLAGFFLQPVMVTLVKFFWLGKNPPKEINYTQTWVQIAVIIPIMAVGFLVAAILWEQARSGPLAELNSFGDFFKEAWRHWPFPISVVFTSLWLLSFCSIRSWRNGGWLIALLAPIPTMGVLHALLSVIMVMLHGWAKLGAKGEWLAYTWAPPLVLYVFSVAIVILIGMLGSKSIEGGREWWGRFGAWLAIYGFGWMALHVAAIYGPMGSAFLLNSDTWKNLSIGGWVGTTVAGLIAGKSNSTDGKFSQGTGAKLMEIIAKVAPFVFITGLLIAVSTLLQLIIVNNSGLAWIGGAPLRAGHWTLMSDASNKHMPVILKVLAACGLGVFVLAARVDINEFSLNAFYRNRLVRCYLGAARLRSDERNPQKFTGFDDKDDLKLATLAPINPAAPGPFHIVNCALNLGGSSDLALHTRHSANFTLTPLHCGSGYRSGDSRGDRGEMGYIKTESFGGAEGQPSLGQAISVSGAAASPNMGYHTSPVVAFLLTLFNVRLGWWFPNPRRAGIDSPSPWFSLRYLLTELFGGADEKSKYLSISDGGHFENLAAYELVKRQCRVILISDGECDPHLRFEGLGALIRMCEVDFGARITIDVGSIRPQGDPCWSRNRCAVGCIEYADKSSGILIYLKASMTGHEGTSVLQYKAAHPNFPHETTGDQFYGEDQFESYRSLGRDIAMRAFEPVADEPGFIELAEKLGMICAPTLSSAGQFIHHSKWLMDLWSRLGENPDFRALDQELTGSWPNNPSGQFRSAFYLCSEIIQLMENVYLDLNLEETWDHADNKGWLTLFKNWTASKALRDTWELTAGTYGSRFQYFCHRHFNLKLPKTNKLST
jgi:hypothetical protein